MTETKGQYKLYELSDRATLATLSDRLTEIEECLEMLEGTDIPADLHQDYLDMLEELKETEDDFTEKVDSILSLIQSRKRWLEIRKKESDRPFGIKTKLRNTPNR